MSHIFGSVVGKLKILRLDEQEERASCFILLVTDSTSMHHALQCLPVEMGQQ